MSLNFLTVFWVFYTKEEEKFSSSSSTCFILYNKKKADFLQELGDGTGLVGSILRMVEGAPVKYSTHITLTVI